MQPPSRFNLNGDTPYKPGNPLEPQLPPLIGNYKRGTLLIAVSNGHNVEDWAIRG